jgi:hypothetical protein
VSFKTFTILTSFLSSSSFSMSPILSEADSI